MKEEKKTGQPTDSENNEKNKNNNSHSHKTKNQLFAPDKGSPWCPENGATVDPKTIRSVFEELGDIFGFQQDNVANMYEYLMSLLESRASRMSCPRALLSVHADYIGGDSANYKQWYFAAYYDLDRGYTNTEAKWSQLPKFLKGEPKGRPVDDDRSSLWGMDYKWKLKMSTYGDTDYISHVALYLLIWGEANNVRFMPECICFLFKCAWDYYSSGIPKAEVAEFDFLDNTITPLYNFIRDQQFDCVGGLFVRKVAADHCSIIGYDDVNLFFWHPANLQTLALDDGTLLHSFLAPERYLKIRSVDWSRSLHKTYLEKRSWVHLLVNFNRVWIIHLALFWYYISLNSPTLYTRNYVQTLDNAPAPQVQLAVIAFGGALACLVCLCGLFGEWLYVPKKSACGVNLALRAVLVALCLALNTAPGVYILIFKGWDVYSHMGCVVGTCLLIFSVATTVYLSIVPSYDLFSFCLRRNAHTMRTRLFTANFASVSLRSTLLSHVLWVSVFTAKLTESYFFLALSMKDPLSILITMDLSRCRGDVWLKQLLCKNFALVSAFLLVVTNFTLFFLDAYLWYIICNCVFSGVLSYSQGTSIFKPWKSKFGKLPDRILTKIYLNGSADENEFAVSKIWNCIVISLYKDHLLSIEQANMLVYRHRDDGPTNSKPIFFNYQEDSASVNLSEFFASNEEASRRISFFARSLSSQLPPPTPIEALPSFTVLAPHYSEKIILTLKDLLKESRASKITLLEYLKKMHQLEWKTFVKDSKLSNHITSGAVPETGNSEYSQKDKTPQKFDDIPLNFLGFKFSQPEFSMRTRLWASARYQTLFRTISGFYNYEKALKVLYYLESYSDEREYLADDSDLHYEIDLFAQRKFRLLVSMQKYQEFGPDDRESVSVLFDSFPNLHVAYIEREVKEGRTTYYSVLLKTGEEGRQSNTQFRIRLSGDPILGDGKSDNQNSSIVFHRGEYIQTIDANQDNYIEECLKVKSVLSEFNEGEVDPTFEYVPGMSNITRKPRVAMLGAREYIFSENIGVLGDVTAGKEQTFGTLFARTLSVINAKLHYGHPDFLNGVFMCTRGGISKAQKGLHLNEDIYAGMNAICRGGLIKHCDYYQCGKGRDLGFDTILNFTTKIGAGMGEQSLSREVFYMGTRLHIDRFLSFYYAHAGFHINNVFITYSVSLFMVVLMCLSVLKHETIMCHFDKTAPKTDPLLPYGCYNLVPVLNWVNRFVLSMFICFTISFLPLVVQELTEKGVAKTVRRIGLHFFSLAPLFEVVVSRVYAKAFTDNIHFGGARYVSTGRGFATSRLPFSEIFRKYAYVSIYPGAMGLLVVSFASLSIWQPALLWFYLTFSSLCFAPFIFNPHQFCLAKMVLDYGDLLRWMFGGNTKKRSSCWPAFKRAYRTKYTGSKKNTRGRDVRDSTHALSSWTNVHVDIGLPFMEAIVYMLPYLFINSQTGVAEPVRVNPIFRLVVLAMFPVSVGLVLNIILFFFNFSIGKLLSLALKKFPSVVSAVAHALSVVIVLVTVEVTFLLHNWNTPRSLCACICIVKLHSLLQNLAFVLLLSREFDGNESNRAWWTGLWTYRTFGWSMFSQPARELVVKTVEMCLFGYDFLLCHVLLYLMTPLALLPFVDRAHTSLLFWMKPSQIFRDPILSKQEMRARKRALVWSSVAYVLMFSVLVAFAVSPGLLALMSDKVGNYVPESLSPLFQPNFQQNNDTGLADLVAGVSEVTLRTVA